MPNKPNIVRIPQACKNCRLRKTKCSGDRPICRTCRKRRKQCDWPEGLVRGHYFAIRDASIDRVGPYSETDGLPSRNVLQKLLDIFWLRHHHVECCSFLDRATFEDNLSHDHNRFLLLSILSLSSLYLTDREIKAEHGFESSISLSDHYASMARKLSRESSDEPAVVTIQANLVLGLRELLAMTDCKAWMYVGLAIRMAQALRMRKEYNYIHTIRQREIRRRTFWACVILDRLIAFTTFRTQTIETELISIHLPCHENAFIFGDEQLGPSMEEISGVSTRPAQIDLMPYFIMTTVRWGDIGAQYANYGRKDSKLTPRDRGSKLRIAVEAMREWKINLPKQVQWSVENLRAHHSLGQASLFVNIHFMINHSLSIAYQEYLPHPDTVSLMGDLSAPDSGVDLAGIPFDHHDEDMISSCLSGANAITDMVRILSDDLEKYRSTLQSPFAGLAILSAASVHLWIRYAGPTEGIRPISKSGFNQSNEEFPTLLSTVRSWSCQWKLAKAWSNSLDLLAELYRIAYEPSDILNEASNGEPDGTDADMQQATLAQETSDESTNPRDDRLNNFQLREGDGLPDASSICQRLYYKIRLILGFPMENSDLCKHILRLSREKMASNTWMYQALACSDLRPDYMLGLDDFPLSELPDEFNRDLLCIDSLGGGG